MTEPQPPTKAESKHAPTTRVRSNEADDGSAGYGDVSHQVFNETSAPHDKAYKWTFLFGNMTESKRRAIQMDDVCFFSITDHRTADRISDILLGLQDVRRGSKVLDGTACGGGNTISFARKGLDVTAIELNEERFTILEHNVDVCGMQHRVTTRHGDLLKIVDDLQDQQFQVIFLDPPWGGVEYMNQESVQLFLSDVHLAQVCHLLRSKTRYFALKVPDNFAVDEFNSRLRDLNKAEAKATDEVDGEPAIKSNEKKDDATDKQVEEDNAKSSSSSSSSSSGSKNTSRSTRDLSLHLREPVIQLRKMKLLIVDVGHAQRRQSKTASTDAKVNRDGQSDQRRGSDRGRPRDQNRRRRDNRRNDDEEEEAVDRHVRNDWRGGDRRVVRQYDRRDNDQSDYKRPRHYDRKYDDYESRDGGHHRDRASSRRFEDSRSSADPRRPRDHPRDRNGGSRGYDRRSDRDRHEDSRGMSRRRSDREDKRDGGSRRARH